MFFRKNKKVIRDLETSLEQKKVMIKIINGDLSNTLEDLRRTKNECNQLEAKYVDTIKALKEHIDLLSFEKEDLSQKNKDLVTKNINLKREVSRLNSAKNQLVKDKDKCKKVIKENKMDYKRDSKGRFSK